MRGHANLEINNPAPGNGGNNPQEATEDWLAPPSGWESWIPTAALGTEEPVTIDFTATVKASKTGSIEFELPYVTSYEGRYMNDKEKEGDRSNDLYFAECWKQAPIANADKEKVGTWSGGGEGSTSIKVIWTEKPKPKAHGKVEIPVKIVCNDFAAYGTIKATLTVDGVESKSKTHKIPKDDQPVYRISVGGITLVLEGNKIADAWEYQDEYKTDPLTGKLPIFHPWSDQDYGGDGQNPHETTGNLYMHGRNNGDGFSALEEYRGFMAAGGYRRLDPFEKDVFIGSFLPSFGGNLKIGKGHFGLYAGLIPGMSAHLIGDLKTEWKKMPGGKYGFHYWVNYTRGGVVGNRQYGIPIIKGLADGALGKASPGHYAALNHGQVCVINLSKINRKALARRVLDVVIAHEIGHAVGLNHHTDEMMEDPTKPRSAHIGPPPDKKWLLFYPDDPSEDSCAMCTEMDIAVWGVYMFVYRNFHSPVPAGHVLFVGKHNPKWEDHWGSYWLHDNHSNYEGY